MKVYLVSQDMYDGLSQNYGIFSTEELANEFINKCVEKWYERLKVRYEGTTTPLPNSVEKSKRYNDYEIEEFELDDISKLNFN